VEVAEVVEPIIAGIVEEAVVQEDY